MLNKGTVDAISSIPLNLNLSLTEQRISPCFLFLKQSFFHVVSLWLWIYAAGTRKEMENSCFLFKTKKQPYLSYYYSDTGCAMKHESWWIVLNVFFHILYWFIKTFCSLFCLKNLLLKYTLILNHFTVVWLPFKSFCYSLWYRTA